MVDADLETMRRSLWKCTELMETMQSIPQVTVAKVRGLATAAGTQLVATCDLAVASRDAGLAAPGGQDVWFCHTPMVAISRAIGRKRAMEIALCGDVIDAETALDWGLINGVVEEQDLKSATDELARRSSRGSTYSKVAGKQTLYRQLDLGQHDAYGLQLKPWHRCHKPTMPKRQCLHFCKNANPNG